MENQPTPEIQRLRLLMIKQGLEAELQGWRLTRKAPRCFKIIATEFGIKGKKQDAYQEFCKRFFPAA